MGCASSTAESNLGDVLRQQLNEDPIPGNPKELDEAEARVLLDKYAQTSAGKMAEEEMWAEKKSRGKEEDATKDQGTGAPTMKRRGSNASVGSCDMSSLREEKVAYKTEKRRSQIMDKEATVLGDGLAASCKSGVKPEGWPNQDSWSALRTADYSIYGIYDGHGETGHDVADFVKEYLPKIILDDPRFLTGEFKAALRENFVTMQSIIRVAHADGKVKADDSGTTCTVAIHDHVSKKIIIAWVGDSAACIARFRRNAEGERLAKGQLIPVACTWDHHPDVQEEADRVHANGGECKKLNGPLDKNRVYFKGDEIPGMAMTRDLGDLLFHDRAGGCFVPSISEFDVGEDDHLLMVCSDGVWEYMSYQDVVNKLQGCIQGEPVTLQTRVQNLVGAGQKKWEDTHVLTPKVDDTTAVVAYLQQEEPPTEAQS